MRRSEFQELADHVFGSTLAGIHIRGLVLEDVGGMTAEQALEAGTPVRRVWTALCDAMDVPEQDRWEIPAQKRRS